jgi:glucan phosphoethanolaminetransferase (alkaline phosphatase superfamily)
MKYKDMLVGTSLLSVLLLSFHLTQDALHARPGTLEAGAGNLVAAVVVCVFLCGPLLAERRLGQIIMLLGALFAIAMPVLHFTSGADMNKHSGAFFFVWCLIALGVTGLFSVLLLTLELPRVWRRPRTGVQGPDVGV